MNACQPGWRQARPRDLAGRQHACQWRPPTVLCGVGAASLPTVHGSGCMAVPECLEGWDWGLGLGGETVVRLGRNHPLLRGRLCPRVRGAQIRTAALTGTQCAAYDQAKQWFMRRTGLGDTPVTHLGASMLTGLATTTITAPIDLIKTNFFVGAPPHRRRTCCQRACNQPQHPADLPLSAQAMAGACWALT